MQVLRCTRKKLDPTWVEREARRIAELLAAVCEPETIYLIGSAGEGKMTDQSDFDFVVVLGSGDDVKRAQKALRPHTPLSSFPVDLIWVTRARFEEMKNVGGICLIAFEDGKRLFDRPGVSA
jgi:predicted nucleotidyltransferase